MKKFTFALMLAAVMVFAAAPLFAEGMMFGVKGGLNMSNVTGDDAEGTSMKIGGLGGVFMSYDITEIFAVQPEILFSMKGFKEEFEGTDYSTSFNYIEIPLLLKVNLPTEGAIKPSLYAGPALGLLMTAKAEDEDIKDFMKTMDIGILAGAGIGYKLENGGLLSLEVRYEIGMTGLMDFTDEELEAEDMTEQPDAKNTAISVMVGYGFAF